MAEYERSRRVQAAPDDVFAFVSDISNLPTFVPTVDAAEPGAAGRVRVHGDTRGGRDYRDEGWFHVDQAHRRVEWGADEHDYSGWLSVSGDDGATRVVAHLSLAPFVTASGRPITGEAVQEPDPVEASLEAALDSLRNLLEGRGGKVTPATAG